MKKKRQLHDDWKSLGHVSKGDFELDIAAGKVRVWDDIGKPNRWRTYRLPHVYKQLLHEAYEAGRKDRIPFERA